MELRDLRYFLACAEESNLTRAAQRLHVAQPTLSHAIARLESEVGEPLFERPKNRRAGLFPTAVGRLLQNHARAMVTESKEFADRIDEMRGLLRGEVRIGSLPSLNATFLPAPLARFCAAYPKVAIELRSFATSEIASVLLRADIDLALLAGAVGPSSGDLAFDRLYREPFALVVRRGAKWDTTKPVPLNALRAEPLVLASKETSTGAEIQRACIRAGFEPRPILVLDSGDALRETVRAGLGITILPERYLRQNDPDLATVRLAPPAPYRNVVLARRKGGKLSRAADVFRQALLSESEAKQLGRGRQRARGV